MTDTQLLRELEREQRKVSFYFHTEEPLTHSNYEDILLNMPLWQWDRFYYQFREREQRHFSAEATVVDWHACRRNDSGQSQPRFQPKSSTAHPNERKGLSPKFTEVV